MDNWLARWLRRGRGRGRHISVLGSLCLLINNICGTAFVQIPTIFDTSGVVYASLLFAAVAAWATVVSLQLAETAARMPGNRSFSHRFELSKLSQALLPRWVAAGSTFLLSAALTALNVGQIVVLAQTMDSALLTAFGKTCALVLQPSSPYGSQHAVCLSADDDALATNSPFGDTRVLSLGYVLTAVLVIPVSIRDLDDSILLQVRRRRLKARGGGRVYRLCGGEVTGWLPCGSHGSGALRPRMATACCRMPVLSHSLRCLPAPTDRAGRWHGGVRGVRRNHRGAAGGDGALRRPLAGGRAARRRGLRGVGLVHRRL
jgi:hypothetical protein